MPKLKFKDLKENAEDVALNARRFYEALYYGMFLNSYEFPQLDQEQSHFLLKQFWKHGCVDAFILPDTIPDKTLESARTNSNVSSIAINKDYPNGLIVFSQFTTSQYNLYDFPSVVTPVNTRGVGFIKYTPQVVNKDCVIGFAHSSHMSIRELVMFYINKIVDVEQTINTNLFAHKLPRLIVCSPEDKMRVESLIKKIENGENALYLDTEDYNAIKNVLDSGGTYIIDKLYQYKTALENEMLTALGIDNIGLEKSERLIVDEANSNNAVINDHSDCFLDTMKAFCKQVTEILKFPLSVRAKSSPAVSERSEIYQASKNEEEVSEDEAI